MLAYVFREIAKVIEALPWLTARVQSALVVWHDFQLTCPPGIWAIALLPGRCLVCQDQGFVVLRADMGDVQVQCCTCQWSWRPTPGSMVGWIGAKLLHGADLLEIARVRCPEATGITVPPGQGVA